MRAWSTSSSYASQHCSIHLREPANLDNNVDEPETNILVKLVLLNNDVDVKFKFDIDKVEFVDRLFKLVNIVVEVLFKLLIDNVELVDKLLTFVVNANTDSVDMFDEIIVVVSCAELSWTKVAII